MVRKKACYGPRCYVLMIPIASMLLLPLRDSFAYHPTGGASISSRRFSHQPQQQQQRPLLPLLPRCTRLPTRRTPSFLRPLKGSGTEQDVTSNDDNDDEEDDSSKLDQSEAPFETTAAAATAAAAEAEAEAAEAAEAEVPAVKAVEEDDGEDRVEVRAGSTGAALVDPTWDLEAEVASFEYAPPMTVRKFKTMQDRRVPVSIKYSGGGGFKRYFEEIAIVLKRHFPDIIIDREIVEVMSTREEQVFEIRIDGKLVCAKRRGKPGVFLHMDTFVQAIRKARQRRRPGSIVYGDQETYQNVKALTDQRTADDSLERDF